MSNRIPKFCVKFGDSLPGVIWYYQHTALHKKVWHDIIAHAQRWLRDTDALSRNESQWFCFLSKDDSRHDDHLGHRQDCCFRNLTSGVMFEWLHSLEAAVTRRSAQPESDVSVRVTRPPTTATAVDTSPSQSQSVYSVYVSSIWTCPLRRLRTRLFYLHIFVIFGFLYRWIRNSELYTSVHY